MTERTLRIARVIVAIVASIELRSLVRCACHAHVPVAVPGGSGAVCTLAALTIGACLLLSRVARGLRLPRPATSWRFAVTWMSCSAALLAALSAHRLFGAGVAPSLPSVAVAVGVGLMLAASIPARHWVWRAIGRLRPWRPSLVRRPCGVVIGAHDPVLLLCAPLLSGWSDRGPPPRPA